MQLRVSTCKKKAEREPYIERGQGKKWKNLRATVHPRDIPNRVTNGNRRGCKPYETRGW